MFVFGIDVFYIEIQHKFQSFFKHMHCPVGRVALKLPTHLHVYIHLLKTVSLYPCMCSELYRVSSREYYFNPPTSCTRLPLPSPPSLFAWYSSQMLFLDQCHRTDNTYCDIVHFRPAANHRRLDTLQSLVPKRETLHRM